MLAGIPVIYIRNGFRLPDAKNYRPQNKYQLPFCGEWKTVNGGVDKERSHSWGICGQRNAYDFYIESEGRSLDRDGRYVTDYYCYGKEIMAAASILVQKGDAVRKGQVIAQCGNSGNTSEPHIHFQIQQSRSFLFSAGLPVYFDGIITEHGSSHYIMAGQLVKNKSDQ